MICFERSSWHVGRISVNTDLELHHIAESGYILTLSCKCNNVSAVVWPGVNWRVDNMQRSFAKGIINMVAQEQINILFSHLNKPAPLSQLNTACLSVCILR